MALHQVVNSIGVKIYNGYWYNNLDWQTHLHKSFEFVFVKKGVLNAVIGNREYKINKGQCALVMPYEAHSYEGNAQYFVAIFSADFCESFSKEINGLIPQRHVFNMDEDALKFLKKYLMAENTDSSNAYRVTDPPYYFIKASIYTICASFYEKVNFIRGVKNNLSITAIIDYIENNFNENITLASLANKLGYDYHYISRLFNETFKINFKTFINVCTIFEEILCIFDCHLKNIMNIFTFIFTF